MSDEPRMGRVEFGPASERSTTHPPGYGLRLITDRKPRCWRCSTVVAWYVTRPWKVMCRKCRALNRSAGESIALGPSAQPAITTGDSHATM